MIRIDRLSLRLPASLGRHAEAIARDIGQRLAERGADLASAQLGRVAVEPIRAESTATPGQVTELAVSRILTVLRERAS